MATRVVLPLLGQTMEEGTIIKWFKHEGDTVEKGEPLLEVMTDKVNMEVESPASGTVRKILAPEEAVVPVKELIAIIGTPDEPIDDILAAEAGPAAEKVGEAMPAPGTGRAEAAEAGTAMSAAGGRLIASPRARRIAQEKGIDIAALEGRGSGPGGRIVEKDVLAHAARLETGARPERVEERPRLTPLATKIAAELGVDAASLAATGPGGKVTREDVLRAARPSAVPKPKIGRVIPLSGMRKAVAESVSRSARSAPHVTLVMEVDMTECARLRNQIAPEFEKRGLKLSFNDLIVKAAAAAVYRVPIVNSTLEDDRITIHDEVNVGIAVALDEGLVAPVVRNVESKSLTELSAAIRDVAGRAREGKLSSDELKGGTITVTNLGPYGIDVFNPIINPPQAAIIGVCRIVDKPVVHEGAITIRSMMNLCLSFDHRVLDGAPAAEYLGELKNLLEAPYLLLI